MQRKLQTSPWSGFPLSMSLKKTWEREETELLSSEPSFASLGIPLEILPQKNDQVVLTVLAYVLTTYGDLYTVVGAVAVEEAGGPKVSWRSGRIDATSAETSPPDGRLPVADNESRVASVQGLSHRVSSFEHGRVDPIRQEHRGIWLPSLPTSFHLTKLGVVSPSIGNSPTHCLLPLLATLPPWRELCLSTSVPLMLHSFQEKLPFHISASSAAIRS